MGERDGRIMRFGHEQGDPLPSASRRRYRALFLSDVHLGSRACRWDRLIGFLKTHEAETIYLVGDIVDGWRLRSNWYWPAGHDGVVRELLGAARRGTRLVYLPGNHDDFLRGYCGTHFAGVEVMESVVHTAADGRRYLVLHGDHFDRMIKRAHRFAALGYRVNRAVTACNAGFNRLRGHFGLSHWSLVQQAKLRVKTATNYLADFETALAELAHRSNVDGVICGHVHHATIRDDRGARYINCGDWVESCTAAVEHDDGRFEILTWTDVQSRHAPDLVLTEARAA
jgi:UDP-2,3-diacylglucosamine pyrophosphatase LpxH